MFYTGSMDYFAQLIGFNRIGALQAHTQYNLSAGYDTFGYQPRVDYFFGLPTAIQPGGVTLDIPINIVTASNSGDREQQKQFVIQSGLIGSALEHATPEQMFNTDPGNPPNAFSAVKGLQLAAAQGQRIYQITPANMSSTLPMLNLDAATETEIFNAVNVGKEVISHTDLVSVPGFTGAGYIILDPETGDGAFKISGGGNGAFIFLFASALVAILGLYFVTILAASSAVVFAEIALLSGLSGILLAAMDPSISLDVDIFIGTVAVLLDTVALVAAGAAVATGAALLSPVASLVIAIMAFVASAISLVRLLALIDLYYWEIQGTRNEFA